MWCFAAHRHFFGRRTAIRCAHSWDYVMIYSLLRFFMYAAPVPVECRYKQKFSSIDIRKWFRNSACNFWKMIYDTCIYLWIYIYLYLYIYIYIWYIYIWHIIFRSISGDSRKHTWNLKLWNIKLLWFLLLKKYIALFNCSVIQHSSYMTYYSLIYHRL